MFEEFGVDTSLIDWGRVRHNTFVNTLITSLPFPIFGSTRNVGAAATAKELNQIAHVFPRAEKGLEGLVRASGGSELTALRAVQAAANQALAEGRIVAGTNGILPANGLGAILNVNGVNVQLIGGRVMNGVVELGSFVGL